MTASTATGAIAGGVLGAVLVLALPALCFVRYKHRQYRAGKEIFYDVPGLFFSQSKMFLSICHLYYCNFCLCNTLCYISNLCIFLSCTGVFSFCKFPTPLNATDHNIAHTHKHFSLVFRFFSHLTYQCYTV